MSKKNTTLILAWPQYTYKTLVFEAIPKADLQTQPQT